MRPDIKRQMYLKRKRRVRKDVKGSLDRPRLNVFRSNRHIYAQIIEDTTGKTLAAFSSLSKEFEDSEDLKDKVGVAKKVGEMVAKKAKEKGILKVVFDRNGFLYHGRVKAMAEGARASGLQF
ncbi:MAG: 50S ribosomal protein L18 [Thermodesulfobacteriota bacterium]